MPDLQGYAGWCMLNSLAPRLLGECSLISPAPSPPNMILYWLWPAMCWPISTGLSPLLSVDSHVAHSPSLRVLIYLGVFRLVAQSTATCSSWFLACKFFTLKMEVICSFKTSFYTGSTWHRIPEDSILHSHHHENLKSYIIIQFHHIQ
jgi:hypothetical protein